MANRRSGAKRRSAQRAAQQRLKNEEAAAGDQTSLEADTTQAAVGSAEGGHSVPTGRKSKPALLLPEAQDVIVAIASLYFDELKPFGRILRKRVAERHALAVSGVLPAAAAEAQLPDVDVPHLRKVCEDSPQMVVEQEDGGDWSVKLLGFHENFVNVYSAEDPWSEEFWQTIVEYFESDADDMVLPGGRYSCAQALLARGLPFLEGLTLGKVCHIVQLAISQRKVLGYLNGAVVPYRFSQSMVKERCASDKTPCSGTVPEAASLPVATWDQAQQTMRQILADTAQTVPAGSPVVVPLSNVKRLFRSHFGLELSETSLGHSKLSELLQDVPFHDVCKVLLEGNGYSVVQVQQESRIAASPLAAQTASFFPGGLQETAVETAVGPAKFCLGEPLNLDDLGEDQDFGAPGLSLDPTPTGYGSTPVPSPAAPGLRMQGGFSAALFAAQEGEPARVDFCWGEPLRLDDAQPHGPETPASTSFFGATPGPFAPTPPAPAQRPLELPDCEIAADPSGYLAHFLPAYLSAAEGLDPSAAGNPNPFTFGWGAQPWLPTPGFDFPNGQDWNAASAHSVQMAAAAAAAADTAAAESSKKRCEPSVRARGDGSCSDVSGDGSGATSAGGSSVVHSTSSSMSIFCGEDAPSSLEATPVKDMPTDAEMPSPARVLNLVDHLVA